MKSNIQFDSKGKFFTPVVDKDVVPSRIQTTNGMVCGNLHIRPGERIKDLLNESSDFVAVTQATAYRPDGEMILEAEFLALNTRYVVWVAEEKRDSASKPTGGQA